MRRLVGVSRTTPKSVCASNLRVGGAGCAPAGLYASHKISSQSVHMCIRCISICISINFSVCLSGLPAFLPVGPSICLPVCLSASLSLSCICLSSILLKFIHIYIYKQISHISKLKCEESTTRAMWILKHSRAAWGTDGSFTLDVSNRPSKLDDLGHQK